jgi:hypothetical protein
LSCDYEFWSSGFPCGTYPSSFGYPAKQLFLSVIFPCQEHFKVLHHEVMTEMVTSSDSYWIPFSTYDGNQNGHFEDIVGLIRLLCNKLASSRYGIFSKMSWTKNINLIIYLF